MLTEDDMLTEEEYTTADKPARDPHPTCAMLRDLRTSAGLTLAQVEKQFGVPAVVHGAYERGDREPPVRKLDAILHHYGYQLAAVPLGTEAVRLSGDVIADLRAIADQLEARLAV